MAHRVIFDHKLRSQRRTGIQRDSRRRVELLVSERADCLGCLAAIASEQVQRLVLAAVAVLVRVDGVHVGN